MARVLLDSGEYRIIRRLEPQAESTQKTMPPKARRLPVTRGHSIKIRGRWPLGFAELIDLQHPVFNCVWALKLFKQRPIFLTDLAVWRNLSKLEAFKPSNLTGRTT